MRLLHRLLFLFLPACLIVSGAVPSWAQVTTPGSQPYNRIHFHKEHWQMLHTPGCTVYFQRGSDSLCAALLRAFPEASALVKQRMGAALTGVPNILIYPSAIQLYESNIGSRSPQYFALPTFVTRGSRILLSYDGSYEALSDQLRQALARSVWEVQLGSASLAAQAKSSTPGELSPFWFKEGALRYFAEGWPVERESALQRMFNSDSLAFFGAVVGKDAALAGQAFCYYLATTYRPDAVKQVFFQLRKRKPLPRALRLVAKRDAPALYADCFTWMQHRFALTTIAAQVNNPMAIVTPALAKTDSVRLPLFTGKKGKGKRSSRKVKDIGYVRSWLLSPSGDQLAWVTQSAGHRRKVFVSDLRTKRVTLLCSYQLPPWLTSYEADAYPLLVWNEHSGELLVVTPLKGAIAITTYSVIGSKGRSTVLPLIDGAGKVIPLADGHYLLAAWLRGQSDLVSYDPRAEKYHPLTADRFDDGEPVLSGEQVFFLSERPKGGQGADSLRLLQGIYSLHGKEVVPEVADTLSFARWSQPVALKDGRAAGGYHQGRKGAGGINP